MWLYRQYFVIVGSCLHVMEEHIGIVRCLCLKGNILISAGDRKRINIWKVKVCNSHMILLLEIIELIVRMVNFCIRFISNRLWFIVCV